MNVREEKGEVVNISIPGLAVPSPPLTVAMLLLPGLGQDSNFLWIYKKEQIGVNGTQMGEVHAHWPGLSICLCRQMSGGIDSHSNAGYYSAVENQVEWRGKWSHIFA